MSFTDRLCDQAGPINGQFMHHSLTETADRSSSRFSSPCSSKSCRIEVMLTQGWTIALADIRTKHMFEAALDRDHRNTEATLWLPSSGRPTCDLLGWDLDPNTE